MKKSTLFLMVVVLSGCSSASKSSLNCEKLHADSEVRVEELKQVLISYQAINYDLAVKLSPPLKQEVADLDSRVRKQKLRCWPKEKRPIDTELALLKDELFKVYGQEEELVALKTTATPKMATPRKPASVIKEVENDIVESVELDSEEN